MKSSANSPDRKSPSYVVGIGASAGGLEALERFFKAMPSDSGMAFVVIQHLSPDFKSLMDELLTRFTKMKVVRVQQPTVMQPDTIYLLSPRLELVIEEGKLTPRDRLPGEQLHMPINRFFRSLAREVNDRAIAIVLSGTGSDGTIGVADVHDMGGLVLAQSEQTSKFDGMTRSAIGTGYVDSVLAPEEMPEILRRYVQNPKLPLPHIGPKVVPEVGLEAMFGLLHEAYGIDFKLYKAGTINRRIERRLALAQVETVEDYCRKVAADPVELDALYRDLLINVTRFFRDPEMFEVLGREVLPKLVETARPDDDLRLWVPACATGEEAYSYGMLLLREFDRQKRPANLKIFATDVHRDSLRAAADGLYFAEAMEALPADLREEFFIHEPDGRFRIIPRLRKAMLFSQHNLISDVPFNRIDLVSCRNLLIYFEPSAQSRALASFHFALSLGGTLVLGPSESPGEFERDFAIVDRPWKIYRKTSENRVSLEMRTRSPLRIPSPPRPVAGIDPRILRVYDQLFSRFVLPGVLVNEKRELMHVFGDASRFLRVPTGRLSTDVVAMCEETLRVPVSSAIHSALNHTGQIVLPRIGLPDGSRQKIVDIVAEQFPDKASSSIFVLVQFRDRPSEPATEPDSSALLQLDTEVRDQVSRLESELQSTKESLQTMVEELETTNEELQASNEELLASNEELQSTNEELHSVNEELYSVNAEHEQKIRELAATSADLRNLINVTNAGIIFVDHERNIRLFTSGAGEILNLMPQDIGRPIAHITSRIKGDNLLEDLADAEKRHHSVEKSIVNEDGRHFLRRITPYQDADKRTSGLVVAFTDITAVRQAEEDRRLTIGAIIDGYPSKIAVVAPDGQIQALNHRWVNFATAHGIAPEEVQVGARYEQACRRMFGADLAEQATALIAAVRNGEKTAGDLDCACTLQGETVWFWVHVAHFSVRGRSGVVVNHTNITSRKRAEKNLAESEVRFRSMHDQMPIGVLTIDRQGRIHHANPASLTQLGYTLDQIRGLSIDALVPTALRAAHGGHVRRYLTEPRARSMGKEEREFPVLRADGSSFLADIALSPVMIDGAPFVLTFVLDITERKRIADEKSTMQRKLEETAKLESLGILAGGIAHDFNNLLTGILGNTELAKSELASDHAVQAYLNDARTACVRASDLCRQMLAYAGKGQYIMQRRDLNLLLRETMDLIRASIGKQIGMHLDLAPGLPAVEMDESQIRQVIMNLVINASDAIGPGSGEIHLRTGLADPAREDLRSLVVTAPSPAGRYVLLAVTDTGCGISPENLKRIFEPFFTTKFVGRGLGLAAVQGIVRSHQGLLGVESTVGRGTTFRLLLPAKDSPPDSTPAVPVEPAPQQHLGTVLVVDDEPIVLHPTCRILEKAGYRCLPSPSGLDALARLADPATAIDLVLLDLSMPGMSGEETFARLRQTHPHLRVVITSGYSENEAISRLGELKPDGFVKKPALAKDLLATLRAAQSPDG